MNVSPKVDFVEDNESGHMPPKIQGVRVIVDATKMNGIFEKKKITLFSLFLLKLFGTECFIDLIDKKLNQSKQLALRAS